jgi:hypothetical protein
MLIGELGLATVLAGGTLAYRAYSKDQRPLQTTVKRITLGEPSLEIYNGL